MVELKELNRRIARIEARNARVESDKAWETSWTRRALLFAFTYVAVGAFFQATRVSEPWLNAIVWAVVFVLSTLTLPFFKEQWLARRKQKN